MVVTTNGSDNSFGFSTVSTTGAITNAVGGTSQSNALMIAQISFTTTSITPQTVSTVTDNQGNTWTKLLSQEAHSGWDTTQTVNGAQKSFTVEIWYTKAATIGTSINITVAFSGTIDSAVVIFSPKYLGYDATNPFDGNASLPKILRGNTSTAETLTGISTTTTHVFPVWCLGIWGTNLNMSNVVFNGVARTFQNALQHNQSEFVKAQMASGPAATGPYSSVTYSSPTSANNYFLIGLALTADVGTPSGSWSSTETTDTFSATGSYTLTLAATDTPDNFFAFGHPSSSGTLVATGAADSWATSQGFEALAIDGTPLNTFGAGTFSLSTNGPNRIIVMAFGTSSVGTQTLQPVTSITSTSGLVFQRSDLLLGGQDSASLDNFLTEFWWAHAPHKLTNDIVSVTYQSGSSSTELSACFAIKGLNGNYNDPFDRINPYSFGSNTGSMVSGTSKPTTQRAVATGPLSTSGAASAYAVFDASNLSHATLSGGSLTVTSSGTNSPDNWAAPVNTAGKEAGNLYYEAHFTTIHGSKYGTGLLLTASGSFTPAGLLANGTGGIVCRGDGTIWAAGVQVGTLGVTPADGDVIQVALNLSNHVAWFRDLTQTGYWNGNVNAHPGNVTDSYIAGGIPFVGALASTPITSELPPHYAFGGAVLPYAFVDGTATSPHASQTYNFGATSFAETPPGGFEGWAFPSPAVPATRTHFPSIVVGLQFTVEDTGPRAALDAPPGYTNLVSFDHQGSQRHGNLNLFAQVRGDNILQSDNDFMLAPNAVKQWTLLYTTFAGGASPGLWSSLEDPDRLVMAGFQSPGVRGDLTATEAVDIFAASGFTSATGFMLLLEPTDRFSAFGFQPLSGTFNTTETTDRFNAAGIGRGEDGVLITTEAPDIFAAIGTVPIVGQWDSTEAADTFRFIGAGVTQVRRRRRRFVT